MNTFFLRKWKGLNNQELGTFSGIHFYYSKITVSLSLAFTLLGVFLFSYLLMNKFISLMEIIIVGFVLVFSFSQAAYLFFLLFLKKPIFILDHSRIYYLKTDKWYDLKSHRFDNVIAGRMNYYLTFRIKDETGKVLISENNWLIKDDTKLHSLIKYYKLHLTE
jgi:hypothetical protein